MPALLKTPPDDPLADGPGPDPQARQYSMLPLLKSVFTGAGEIRRPVTFEWRLIRRHQWPFLLLPVTLEAGAALKLYSPQRPHVKFALSLFPLLFKTPVAGLFERVRFRADADAEFIRFLMRQTGGEWSQFSTPVIKFGGTGDKSRIVLLVCDETQRPASVIKVGLGPSGRAATDREADLLAQLPPAKIGCTRMTGRFSTAEISAFATAYYPGDSPSNDAGMEQLFADWLNPGAAAPVESLDSWRQLEAAVRRADPEAWEMVRTKLAGRSIRTTLYHGDFAPWNIRAINARNLQAFDWERGSLQGIPGWDWFHFIAQTAILARRLSVERTAAEMEEVLHSARFIKYADQAGISELVKPLFLASLLHQKWVVKPLEGGRAVGELFSLLAERWYSPTRPHLRSDFSPAQKNIPGEGARVEAGQQLRFAAARLSNLFWEPSLNATVRPSLLAEWRAHWRTILPAGVLLAGLILVQFRWNPHMVLLQFYMLSCALATWRAGRHWGTLFAVICSVAAPVAQRWNTPDLLPWYGTVWNLGMRFLFLEMGVLLLDRILQQNKLPVSEERANFHSGKIADNWAVLLASGVWLGSVVTLQFFSPPHLMFLPLYLIVCATLVLTVGWPWALGASVVSAAAGPLAQNYNSPGYQNASEEWWNIVMRFIILQVMILLLHELLQNNVLFSPKAPQSEPEPPADG
jgi:hypothetical protein